MRQRIWISTLFLWVSTIGAGQPNTFSQPLLPAALNPEISGAYGSAPNTKPHSVELTWKASTTPAIEGYYVYRAEGESGNYERITPKPIKNTQYEDQKVQPGKSYAYAVSTVQKIEKQLVESEWTAAITVRIPDP